MGSAISTRAHLSQAKTKLAAASTLIAIHEQTKAKADDTRADDNSDIYDESQLTLTAERRATRRDIFEFIATSKRDKLLVDSEADDSSKFVSKYDRDESDVMEDTSAYVIPEKVEPTNVCSLCQLATKYLLDGFPCRVCSSVFHEQCLRDSTRNYTPQELKLLQRAKTRIGWSCEQCDNLCNLLSPEDLQTVSEEFEKMDVNKNADITLEEFMTSQKKEHELLFEKPMDDFEEDLLQFKFKMLDADKSGTIDYKELMNYQVTKTLGKKDKLLLVKLLSANEIRAARTLFELLDANKDGTVSESEARDAYRSFYSTLDTISSENTPIKKPGQSGLSKPDIETQQVATHVATKASIVMDADENDDCYVDWKEFIRGQALSIVSSRPNKYGIPSN